MYGAILGDIIGSPFEFDRGEKTKEFELFTKGCHFTDDTVMTIAVAEALLRVGPEASVKTIEAAVVSSMVKWGHRYPDAGYGGRFNHWLYEKNPKPYNSFGNGSAMRVSAIGWLYDSLERTREVAGATARVSHNHPEGIKGAEATASAIYMARNGASKEEIKKYIEHEFHYNLNRTLDEIRPDYHMNETCQKTVPEAVIAFLEAEDFEDAIRNAVSLGGDTDTLAAITGGIAEAYFGIPAVLIVECRDRVNDDLMKAVFEKFDNTTGRKNGRWSEQAPELIGNKVIEKAIDGLYAEDCVDRMLYLIWSIVMRMQQDGCFAVPYITDVPLMTDEQMNKIQIGQSFSLNQDVKFKIENVVDKDGREWIGVFTSSDEMAMGSAGNIQINQPILNMFKLTLSEKQVEGIVINPYGVGVKLDKNLIELIIKEYDYFENWKKEDK